MSTTSSRMRVGKKLGTDGALPTDDKEVPSAALVGDGTLVAMPPRRGEEPDVEPVRELTKLLVVWSPADGLVAAVAAAAASELGKRGIRRILSHISG